MKELRVDINGAPLSRSELQRLRSEAESALARAKRNERMWLLASWLVAIVSAALGYALWETPGDYVHVGVGVVGMMALAPFWAGIVYGRFFASFLPAAVLCLALALASLAIEAWAGELPWVVVLVSCGACSGMVVWLWAFNRTVILKRNYASRLLAEAVEISPDSNPDQCISWVEWCEKHPDLRIFQNKITGEDRSPILAEYRAAEEWVENRRAERATAEKARRARGAYETMRPATRGGSPSTTPP